MASNTVAAARRQVSLPPIIDERRPSIKAVVRQASLEPSKIAADAARARSASVEPEILTPKATSPAPQPSVETREQSVEPQTTAILEPPPPPGAIDVETFQQILELDEEGTYEFSRGMTWAYFSQAITTFHKMKDALETKDHEQLSQLGHFLKGSSAALGVSKVQASCEKIQHYGALRDEEADRDLKPEEALKKVESILGTVMEEYNIAEQWLKKWYSKNDPEAEVEV